MEKQQRNRIIGQIVLLSVLVIAILFALTGGGTSGESTNSDPATRLELGEVKEVPASLGNRLDAVEAEIDERDMTDVEPKEFNGPNENLFNQL